MKKRIIIICLSILCAFTTTAMAFSKKTENKGISNSITSTEESASLYNNEEIQTMLNKAKGSKIKKNARIKKNTKINMINKKVKKANKKKIKKNSQNKEENKEKEGEVKTIQVDFQNMSPEEIVNILGCVFTEEQRKSGILASVSMAQFLLESGFGRSELSVQANNYFGIKANVSGNNWEKSTWKGETYKVITKEEVKGKIVKQKALFRAYDGFNDSVEDHTAYLQYAQNGYKLRYAGITEERDYKKAVNIIVKGGYATGSTYKKSLCSLIEKYKLTRFDINN